VSNGQRPSKVWQISWSKVKRGKSSNTPTSEMTNEEKKKVKQLSSGYCGTMAYSVEPEKQALWLQISEMPPKPFVLSEKSSYAIKT
jgi:lipoprotein-anchoring transpeptidase ErfK/SrfK